MNGIKIENFCNFGKRHVLLFEERPCGLHLSLLDVSRKQNAHGHLENVRNIVFGEIERPSNFPYGFDIVDINVNVFNDTALTKVLLIFCHKESSFKILTFGKNATIIIKYFCSIFNSCILVLV